MIFSLIKIPLIELRVCRIHIHVCFGKSSRKSSKKITYSSLNALKVLQKHYFCRFNLYKQLGWTGKK